MDPSRRALIGAAALAPGLAVQAAVAPAGLPDKANFPFEGTYLDAAFTHPFGRFAAAAGHAYEQIRLAEPHAIGPGRNARHGAVERFARLINADPTEIAVVPSTLEGENLVNAALGIGPGAGVVTDALHYDGSLVLYGEMQRHGVPVGVVRPRDGRIDLADLKALITPKTRLVAVSLVSSTTGFMHDLPELCALAHRQGALVYADIIQAAGAMPVDVKASGVDFACCGTYKWLMGDFGTAFLYVRGDRLDRLKRPQVGWRQVRDQESHVLPLEPPGPAIGPYQLSKGTAASIFEVSTPAWAALAVGQASLDYILARGVAAISNHVAGLNRRLQDDLPSLGFTPLTPRDAPGPLVAFACRDARARFAPRLSAASITVSLYEHRIRISPSVCSSPDDVSYLIATLRG
jgi:selenocysteine lyase/cysteine desulfurase